MSTSIKVIRLTCILSIIFFVITYLITVNIESGLIQLNTIWITNNFLLTIFGGTFASTLVVLLCEINKYLIDKKNTENQLFYQTMYLYHALFLMQHNILDFQSHPDEQIPENIFDDTTQMIKSQVYCLRIIDYACFKKDNAIEQRHTIFKEDTFIKFSSIENGANLIHCAILEERIENHKRNLANPNYITSSCASVAKVLSDQLESLVPLLEETDDILKTIDDNCKNRYGWNEIRNMMQNIYTSFALYKNNNVPKI